MNITRSQLRKQFDRAVALGWLPFFQEAAQITAGYFDVADLMGIGSRETNLDPIWLKKKGDNGHGCGLLQIDDRSFPEFTSSTKWQDARLGILKGAEVLMSKWRDYENNIGKRISVKGKYFTAKAAGGVVAQHIVLSSYNCGRWSQYCWAQGISNIDKYSTGHDYGADVMGRAAVIRGLLKDSAASGTSQAQTLTGNAEQEGTDSTPQNSLTPDNEQTDPNAADKQQQGQTTTFDTPGGGGQAVTTSTNVAVEKEQQVGFLAKIKLKLVGWFATLGGLTGINQYKQQFDDLGLPGWIILYLIIGVVIGAIIWLLCEFAFHIIEWWGKRKRTDTLATVNSTPTNTVLIVPQDQLAQYADKGWVVIHRSNAPDKAERPWWRPW